MNTIASGTLSNVQIVNPSSGDALVWTESKTWINSSMNNPTIINAANFPGLTADVQIANAIASLPSEGGIIDARAIIGTQIISNTLALGASNGAAVEIYFNPSTHFVPYDTTMNMFTLLPSCIVQGLTTDVTAQSGYSGVIMTLAGYNYNNQPGYIANSNGQTKLKDFTIFAVGNTTGTGILLLSAGSANGIEYCYFENIQMMGLQYGIILRVTETGGYITSCNFIDTKITAAVYPLLMDTSSAISGQAIYANDFYAFSTEATNKSPLTYVTIYNIWMHGKYIQSNNFYATRLWDLPTGGGRLNINIDDSSCIGNYFSGLLNLAGQLNDASNQSIYDTEYGTRTGGQINATVQGNAFNISNERVMGGDGTNTFISPMNAATGVIQLFTNNSNDVASYNNVGDFSIPGVYHSQAVAGISTGTLSSITAIQSTGGLVTTLTGASDARLKEDITPFKKGLSAVTSIEPCVYGWNEKGRDITGFSKEDRHIGFIAQQVKEHIPEAVTIEGEFMGLADRPMLAAIVNAIKQLKNKNKKLKTMLKGIHK